MDLSYGLNRMGPQYHVDRGKDSFYQVLLTGLKAEARRLTNLSEVSKVILGSDKLSFRFLGQLR